MSLGEPGVPGVPGVPDPRTAASRQEVCPLCGAQVRADDARCPECNMILAGVGSRPRPFTREALWWWAAALGVVYLVVLAIVLAAR